MTVLVVGATLEDCHVANGVPDAKYTVKWLNDDGTELEVDAGLKRGETPSYDGAEPTKGSVFVDGTEVNRIKKSRVPYLRRSMGIVFQDFRLLPNKTAAENVSFAMEVIETPRRIMKERVRTVLDLVGLSGKADELPQNLSGGEQQRVAIARAIVNRPLLLIADEPTGNLDPDTSKGIMDIFTKINHMGTTVLMVTHDKQMVDLMNKRVIEIDNGRIVRDELKGGYGNEN